MFLFYFEFIALYNFKQYPYTFTNESDWIDIMWRIVTTMFSFIQFPYC